MYLSRIMCLNVTINFRSEEIANIIPLLSLKILNLIFDALVFKSTLYTLWFSLVQPEVKLSLHLDTLRKTPDKVCLKIWILDQYKLQKL